MKVLQAVAVLLLLISSSDALRQSPSSEQYAQFFSRWMASRNRTYPSERLSSKFDIYKANFDFVEDHNERFSQGLEAYDLELNDNADLSNDEFRFRLGYMVSSYDDNSHAQLLGSDDTPTKLSESEGVVSQSDSARDRLCQRFSGLCPPNQSASSSTGSPSASISTGAPSPSATPSPSSTVSSTGLPGQDVVNLDWRDYGYVSAVKDQGSCGSCWAFASTAVMEAAWAVKTGEMLSFSEQELLDCAANGQRTCSTGGSMHDSWTWLLGSGTSSSKRSPMSQASYPYTSSSAASCQYNSASATSAVFASKVTVRSGEDALLAAVKVSPSVAVAIHGSSRAFQLYKSGVLSDSSCSSTTLDHAVTVVGYGTDSATGYDYWLIKNSWTEAWGDQGYMKVRRNFNNMCGIATDMSYVVA